MDKVSIDLLDSVPQIDETLMKVHNAQDRASALLPPHTTGRWTLSTVRKSSGILRRTLPLDGLTVKPIRNSRVRE